MKELSLEYFKKFYEERIKGWMMGDLHKIKDKGANIITSLGCLAFTEAIGLYLPELDNKGIEEQSPNIGQKRFYRCLFRLESREHLMEYDEKIRKITKGSSKENGIYQLRNRVAHKYLLLVTPQLILVRVYDGLQDKPSLPFPISLKEKGGKIEEVIINNAKYIEELQKLVDDVYDKIFIEKDDTFIKAMRSGHSKLFEDD